MFLTCKVSTNWVYCIAFFTLSAFVIQMVPFASVGPSSSPSTPNAAVGWGSWQEIGGASIAETGYDPRVTCGYEPSEPYLAYVAAGSQGLIKYNINNPAQPWVVNTIATGGMTRDVAVLYSRACVVDSSSDKLYVLSTGGNMAVNYQLAIPGGDPVCVAMYYLGTYCFVGTAAATGNNFFIINIGSPAAPVQPTIVGQCRVTGTQYRISIFILSGAYEYSAWVATGSGNSLVRVNFRDAVNPVQDGSWGYGASVNGVSAGGYLQVLAGSTHYTYNRINMYQISATGLGAEGKAFDATGSYTHIVTSSQILLTYPGSDGVKASGPVATNPTSIARCPWNYQTPERAVVVGGNTGARYLKIYDVGYDNVVPSIAVNSPGSGSYQSPAPVIQTFITDAFGVDSNSVTATIGTNTFSLVQVGTSSEFRLDNTPLGDWNGWVSNWQWNTPDGQVTITISATDINANIATKNIPFTKDTILPSVTIQLPSAPPQPVFGPSTGAPTVLAAISDTNLVPSTIRCSINDWYEVGSFAMYEKTLGVFAFDTESPDWNTWGAAWMDSDGLSTGLYTIHVQAYDLAGNRGVGEVEIYWDVSPPVIVVSEPDFRFGPIVYGAGSAIPTFRIGVWDPNIDPMSVNLVIGVRSFSLGANPTLEFPHDFVLAPGFGDYGGVDGWATFWQSLWPDQYFISFTASDIVGNTGSDSGQPPYYYVLIIDLAAPFVTINTPTVNSWHSEAPPVFDVTMQDFETNVGWVYYSLDTNPIWGQGTWYEIVIAEPKLTVTVTGTIDTNGWQACSQGAVLLTFRAFDTGFNGWQESRTIYKDTVNPSFTINDPDSGVSYFEGPLAYNLAINELHLASIWVSGDGWVTYYQLSSVSGTLPSELWSNILPYDTSIRFDFAIVDLAGNLAQNYIEVVRVDSMPLISILNPLSSSETCYGSSAPTYDLTVTNWDVLSRLWVSLDGGMTQYELETQQGTLSQEIWSQCLNGVNTLLFHAESLYGRSSENSIVIAVDNQGPAITIVQPQDENKIGATPPMYVLRVMDEHLDYIYITFDGGQTRVDVPITQLSGTVPAYAWDAAYAKTVLFEVVAVDTFGNMNSAKITIIRSDWIRPDSGTHDARGDDVGFGLFFYMPMEAMIYLGIVFVVVLGVLIINHRRNERAEREGIEF